MEFKVGDKVRLTGRDWETYEDADVSPGAIVEITEVDDVNIWAGEAGTVGNRNGLYSENNPEGSGDYSCELVSGNSEEAIRNRRDIFAETVAKLTGSGSAFSKEEVGSLGQQLGIATPPDAEERAHVRELLGVPPFEQSVRRHTDRIANVLVEKNKSYGDSALNPVRIFSKADRMEQLYIRLDDKISRVKSGHEYPGDDTIQDIIGYCVLILIARESA